MKNNVTAISIRDLSFGYDAKLPCFMEGLSLDVREGSVCALLGPNGSGKTTLMLLILGMLRPVKGDLSVFDAPMQGKHRPPKHLVGLVPQEESISFGLSVLEYVLMGRAPHLGIFDQPGKEDRDMAVQALRMADILHLRDREVPSLSGGERQLAMVSRVLAQESRIMLMDEPTSHLDLSNTRRVLDLIRMLRKNGKTVVFSTHDPNAAAAVADHIVLMKNGGIFYAGNPSEVLNPENLSEIYGVTVEVIQVNGRPLVIIE